MGRRIQVWVPVVLALALFASVETAAAPPPLTGPALLAPVLSAQTINSNSSWGAIHSLWLRIKRVVCAPTAEAGTPAGGTLTTPTYRAGLLVDTEAVPGTSNSATEGAGRGDEASGPWP